MLNITPRKASNSCGLNNLFSNIISGRLAPPLPMTKAIMAPMLTPFAMKDPISGNSVVTRMYKGIPIIVAIGIAAGLSALATFAK